MMLMGTRIRFGVMGMFWNWSGDGCTYCEMCYKRLSCTLLKGKLYGM